MKIYFKVIVLLLGILFVGGYLLPFLISYPSTEVGVIGVMFIAGFIPVLHWQIWDIYHSLKKERTKMEKKKNRKRNSLSMVLLFFMLFTACSKVPAGNVGVKVYLLGGAKGVESEQLGVGRYWIGLNEELYLFPTFTQNYVWTKSATEGSLNDESVTFQTVEGMSVGADVGISYAVKPDQVSVVFQKYRKQLPEITDVYLRNMVRDAFVSAASTRKVEEVYGVGKTDLLIDVEARVREQAGKMFNIERIYLVGDLRLPPQVTTALNAKIQATQKAQQKENEVAEAKAEAKKVVAKANGDAEALLMVANAQAEANRVLSESLTPELVQYQAIKVWDGVLPTTMLPGGSLPLVKIN